MAGSRINVNRMIEFASKTTSQGPLNLSLSRRKRMIKGALIGLLAIYAIVTLIPFYVLFVRTFVGTKDATDLHLWIPPGQDVPMNYGIGNLSVFYNLDLKKFKQDMGIAVSEYLPASMTLQEMADQYQIPASKIKEYFSGFSVWNGWKSIVGNGAIWPPLIRTTVITIVSVILLNVLSIFTGIGLAGLRRRDQMFWYNLYLAQMVIPFMLIILPQYLIIEALLKLIPGYDVIGSATRNIAQIMAVILINVRGGAVPIMVYTSFISAVPRELEEAAVIDGATRWQYLTHILLPLLKVPIAAVTVIHLPLFWNQFFEPFIYLDTQNTTLLPFIQGFAGQYNTNFQATFAAIFVSILPLVLIYIVFRRWFISGVMSGAIKG